MVYLLKKIVIEVKQDQNVIENGAILPISFVLVPRQQIRKKSAILPIALMKSPSTFNQQVFRAFEVF